MLVIFIRVTLILPYKNNTKNKWLKDLENTYYNKYYK